MEAPSITPELDLMRLGTEYRFPVTIRKFSIMLRVLTIAEKMMINQEVITEVLKLPETMRHSLNENYLLAKSMLKMASTEDCETKTLGPLTDLILDKMTSEEVLFAYKQWRLGCESCDPEMEKLSKEESAVLVAMVKKKDSLPVTELSLRQLQTIAKHFLAQDD